MRRAVCLMLLGATLLASPGLALGQEKINEAWSRMSRIQAFLEWFYLTAGAAGYPSSLQEMERAINAKAPKGMHPIAMPVDPATNKPFKYSTDPQGTRYTLTVPDPSAYGGAKPTLTSVDLGFLPHVVRDR